MNFSLHNLKLQLLEESATSLYLRQQGSTGPDGKEKWTAAQVHQKRVRHIDADAFQKHLFSYQRNTIINFEVSELPSSETSGLSHVFEYQSLSQQSNPSTTSLAGNEDDRSSLAGPITPKPFLSHGSDRNIRPLGEIHGISSLARAKQQSVALFLGSMVNSACRGRVYS